MSLIYSFIQTEYTQIYFNEKGIHHQRKKKQKKQKIEEKKTKTLLVKAKANENSYLREKRNFINLFSD